MLLSTLSGILGKSKLASLEASGQSYDRSKQHPFRHHLRKRTAKPAIPNTVIIDAN